MNAAPVPTDSRMWSLFGPPQYRTVFRPASGATFTKHGSGGVVETARGNGKGWAEGRPQAGRPATTTTVARDFKRRMRGSSSPDRRPRSGWRSGAHAVGP